MKKKLLQSFTVFASVLSMTMEAQTYEPLQVSSGFTQDVIANGPGSALNSSTIGIDNANICFMANDFQPGAAPPPAYGIPATGLISSAATTGLTFQLGPLSGNNSLRLQEENDNGTLVFSNGVQASRLYVLATTGSGSATISATVHFTDDSEQLVSGGVIPDWFFSNALPVALSGMGRVYRNTNVTENPSGDPRIYQYAMELLPSNQLKTIESIEFTKISAAEGALNIFAVTAEETGTCPSPAGISAVATADAAVVSWSPAVIVPAGGYDYYYSTSSTPPIATTTPSGNVGSAINTVNLSSLTTGMPYYAWVRSNCGTTEAGGWIMVTFTPGQLSGSGPSEIPTLFSDDDPDTNTTNNCPGTLTINVPAGYQIASVATSYTMTTASNGWKSEQRSVLTCPTTGTSENAVSAGTGNSGGTQAYSRTGLTFANGATGTVQFELRAWRMYGGSDCNTTWNRVDPNWTVTVTYSSLNCVTPADPVAAAQQVCTGSTLAGLQVTGESNATFKWYSAATGGTALLSTTVLAATTYYVSQVVGGCESNRVPVAVTFTTVATPTASAQSFCPGATVANLVASGAGTEFNWYSAAAGGSELVPAAILAQGTYYVSQSIGGCESTRVGVAVTITTVPVPVAGAQALCPGSTVANLTATGTAGSEINWYTTASGGTELVSTAVVTQGTYYVSQTVGSCESTRVAVTVTVAAPSLPVAANQNFCPDSAVTVNDLVASGTTTATFNWYTTATGGTALAGTLPLTAGTYYVSQTVGTCESAREDVVVTFNATPVPDIDDTVTGCYGIAVNDATGGSDAFHVYAAPTGGSPLAGNVLFTTGTYYITQTINGCESTRLPISITVIELDAPVLPAGQEFCSGATLADIEADYTEGAVLQWYEEEGGVMLPGATVLVTGTTYYATQVSNECESGAAEVSVTVHATPAMPGGDDVQDFNPGETIASLNVTTETGATVTWYIMDGSDFVVADTDTELEDGVIYYCAQSANGCESEFRAIEANELLSTGAFGLKNLMVYPNPANDLLTVSNDSSISLITITNLLGQKVMDVNGDSNEMKVNVSQLAQGSYILQVYSGSGLTSVKIAKK
ncbi:T9SS type A sorting domain-containing protein [Flavobacterium sp. DGU11]|uniref:T9SS type A sorting domain-containing protein n=1 Tax=Flavobacterium arundinis TaxID=3139143 RepID=A0ABU9HW07_9FLAO